MNTAERYLRFANEEARGESSIYERLAQHVASDAQTLLFLDTLPRDRRQPNLLFGAVRLLSGSILENSDFTDFVHSHRKTLRATMLSHSTQTNEPARTATLLPLFVSIPGPLALMEVGASAGLCLLPDQYAYQYNSQTVISPKTSHASPLFKCTANAATPIPRHLPEVLWRRGVDINPLAVTQLDDMQWLQALIWPEHVIRLSNFNRAVDIACSAPPKIDQGDLLTQLEASIKDAPTDATLVIFHSAVLSYISTEARRQFRELVEGIDCVWISNEDTRLFPDIAKKTDRELSPKKFLLSMDGHPIAQTGPHGQSIDWLPETHRR